MSKKYFEKHKQQRVATRGLVSSSNSQFAANVESPAYIKEYTRNKNEFIPQIDYEDPSSFAKYGSAQRYYEKAFQRIYKQYPYDGSLAEKLKFYNDLTPLEKYIFDNKYPRTNGYITIGGVGATTWDAAGSTSAREYGETSTSEYITVYGGPHVDNIFDTSTGRDNNLQFDLNSVSGSGNTVEFWFKKNAFVGSNSPSEVIFDLSNGDSQYGRLTVWLHKSHPTKVFTTIASGSIGAGVKEWATSGSVVDGASGGAWYTFETGLTTIADSAWHHYAIVLQNKGDDAVGELYVDGAFKQKITNKSRAIGAVTGTMQATIGALHDRAVGDNTSAIGWGKISGSIDEFRYWKTARTAQQVGRNYFRPIGGGTNTDDEKYNTETPVDLGFYFKFNEGVVGDSTKDAVVLDYSGRASNGTWTGYYSGTRNTGSAIVESLKAPTEELDPIVYDTHPDVLSVSGSLSSTGSAYDAANSLSLYSSIPQWIRDDDQEGSLQLEALTQIMGSYLDTLHAQISNLNKIKDQSYVTGTNKPITFGNRLLTSLGFETPNTFVSADVLESIFQQNDKEVFQAKIEDIKNLIYKNIYNNLNFINKSKGTEKSFRNLFRCFGVDNELFRLNMYGDNVEYSFEDTFEVVSLKKKTIDFSGHNGLSSNQSATVYQYPLVSGSDFGFISCSVNLPRSASLPFTAEAEIFFPKPSPVAKDSGLMTITSASLFGCFGATGSAWDTNQATTYDARPGADYTTLANYGPLPLGNPKYGFQVYAIKDDADHTHFKLTSQNNFLPTITSSVFPNSGSAIKVYDNTKWNFAVRFRPLSYQMTSLHTASATTYIKSGKLHAATSSQMEFYGVCMNGATKLGEFSVSASIEPLTASFFLNETSKRFYVGAERTNFTGSGVINKSDVRFSSLRLWMDYITDEEMRYHAMDSENFGRTNPYEHSFIYEDTGSFTKNHIPRIETLALNWDFSNITASNSDGGFNVLDRSSGSFYQPYSGRLEAGSGYLTTPFASQNTGSHPYGIVGEMAHRHHTGIGAFFESSSTDVVSLEFFPAARQLLPENMYSSNLISLVNRSDERFTREKRPSKYFFAVESSMYDVISQNMLNFFASIDDFNNLIGEPAHKYRDKYKGIEKLRQLFFSKIKNTPDLDKFVELYKWLDNSLDLVLGNLIPASANAADTARTIVESHVLERSKYRHKINNIQDISTKELGIKATWPPRQLPDAEHNRTIEGFGLENKKEGEADTENNYSFSKSNLNLTSDSDADIQVRTYSPFNIDELATPFVFERQNYVDISPPLVAHSNSAGPGYQTISASLDKTKNALWWKYRAERDRGELVTGASGVMADGVVTSRTQLHHTLIEGLRDQVRRPLTDTYEISPTYHGGVNVEGEPDKNWEYHRGKFVLDDAFGAAGVILTGDARNDGIRIKLNTSSVNHMGEPYEEHGKITGSENVLYDHSKQRKYPIVATDDGGEFYSQERLPFSIYSSSVTKGYQVEFKPIGKNIAIENIHQDTYGPYYEVPMQGPFTEQHVGGLGYRHGQLLTTDPTKRVEGYRINVKSTNEYPISVNYPRYKGDTYSNAEPYGGYYRDEKAKRPVNIRNIKRVTGSVTSKLSASIFGNYEKDYEIVLTTGRGLNNRWFVEGEANTIIETGSTYIWWPATNALTGNKEITMPNREETGSNSFIIVNRFSSRGGPAVESDTFMDLEGGEYSPYNALPWQNLVAKNALNEMYTRHATGAYDSLFLDSPSFHKIPKNVLVRPDPHYAIEPGVSPNRVEHMHDNYWISHQIPRTDLNYKWIRDSWIGQIRDDHSGSNQDRQSSIPRQYGWRAQSALTGVDSTTSSNFQPLLGFDFSYDETRSWPFSQNLNFVSASEYGSYALGSSPSQRRFGIDRYQAAALNIGQRQNASIKSSLSNFVPQDFVGMNTLIYEPVCEFSQSNNAIGGPNWGTGSVFGTREAPSNVLGYPTTASLLFSQPGPASIGLLQRETTYLNTNFNRYAGSKQKPSDTHGGIGSSLSHAEAAIFNILMLKRNGPYGYPSWKQIRTGQHPVARWHKENNLYNVNDDRNKRFLFQSPVSSKHRPVLQSYDKYSIKYPHGNEHVYFAKSHYDGEKIIDPNPEYYVSAEITGTTLDSLSAEQDWNYIRYSEFVYPRDENTFRAISQGREKFESFYAAPKELKIGLNSQEKPYWSKVLTIPWPMEIKSLCESGSVRGALYQESAGNWYWDSTGELMHTDNSQYFFKSLTKCSASIGGHAPNQAGVTTKPAFTYSSNMYAPYPGGPGDNVSPPDFGFAEDGKHGAIHGNTDLGEVVTQRFGRYYNDFRPENLVHKQAATGAFYGTYDEFAEDVRLFGKDYGILPEFSITEHVRDVGSNFSFDYYQDIYNFEATGSEVALGTTKYMEALSHADPISNLKHIRKTLGEPSTIRLKMHGILKLLPREGFYPVQQCMRLGSEFSRSYGDSTKLEGQERFENDLPAGRFYDEGGEDIALYKHNGSWRTALQPFYSPGICYNSIRAGLAVDYPIIEDETWSDASTACGHGTAKNDLPQQSGLGRLTSSYSKRLPFEAILEPEYYARRLRGNSTLEQKYALKLYDYDPDMPVDSTASLGATDGVYEKFAHNFYGEVPHFFLDGLARLVSKPEKEWIFEAPLSASATGIKTYVMDVVLEKTPNYTNHNAAKYYGHYPYYHHVPPYWTMGEHGWRKNQDEYGETQHSRSFGISEMYQEHFTGSLLYATASHEGNKARYRITFDPSPIERVDPERFTAGKFTFEDIKTYSKFEFYNVNMDGQYGKTGISTCSMGMTASLNIFGKDYNKNRWVISSKWECPMLNFHTVESSSFKIHPLAESGIPAALVNKTHVMSASNFVGMWHQFGNFPKPDEGIFLTLQEPSVATTKLTGSLIKSCGFEISKKRIGAIKKKKQISEAIVAIPFYHDKATGKNKYFEIPLKRFEDAYAQVTTGKSITNSIEDMVYKMTKYMMLPQYDFVHIRQKANKSILQKIEYKPAYAPFSMYILEFTTTLEREDLRKIWQNVMPEIAVSAQFQNQNLEHPFKDGELLSPEIFKEAGYVDGKMPDDIRWKIFKIKKRAECNYYKSLEKLTGIKAGFECSSSDHFHPNWPYDYFSLVELGKMEVSLGFKSQSTLAAMATPPVESAPVVGEVINKL